MLFTQTTEEGKEDLECAILLPPAVKDTYLCSSSISGSVTESSGISGTPAKTRASKRCIMNPIIPAAIHHVHQDALNGACSLLNCFIRGVAVECVQSKRSRTGGYLPVVNKRKSL